MGQRIGRLCPAVHEHFAGGGSRFGYRFLMKGHVAAVGPFVINDALKLIGIEKLHGKYQLAVISDAIFSPGRALRQLLEHYGLLKYFKAFAFSDEIGYAKPMPIVFETIAKELDIKMDQIVHIGDREEKDIAGPHAVGARAVFCTFVKDRGVEKTKGDAICKDFRELPDITEKLNNS